MSSEDRGIADDDDKSNLAGWMCVVRPQAFFSR